MDTVERICRTICKAENVDPDKEVVGLGYIMPEGQRYKLWEAREKQARAIIAELKIKED